MLEKEKPRQEKSAAQLDQERILSLIGGFEAERNSEFTAEDRARIAGAIESLERLLGMKGSEYTLKETGTEYVLGFKEKDGKNNEFRFVKRAPPMGSESEGTGRQGTSSFERQIQPKLEKVLTDLSKEYDFTWDTKHDEIILKIRKGGGEIVEYHTIKQSEFEIETDDGKKKRVELIDFLADIVRGARKRKKQESDSSKHSEKDA